MRPRPMKPHVARFEVVEEKERRVLEDEKGAGTLLLRMQRRRGESRMETVALIVADWSMQSDRGYNVTRCGKKVNRIT